MGGGDVRPPDDRGVEHAGRRAGRPRREGAAGRRRAVPGDRLPLPGDDRHPRRRRRDVRREDRQRAAASTPSPSRTPCSAATCSPASRTAAASCARSSRCERTLAGYDAWVTGVRRVEAPTRANTPLVTYDEKHGLVKINPIAAWSDDAAAGLHRRAPRAGEPAGRRRATRRSAAAPAPSSRCPAPTRAPAAGPGAPRPNAGSTRERERTVQHSTIGIAGRAKRGRG